MKRLLNIFIVFVLGIMFLSPKNIVYAALCSEIGGVVITGLNSSYPAGNSDNTLNLIISGLSDSNYTFIIDGKLDDGTLSMFQTSATAIDSKISLSLSKIDMEDKALPGTQTPNIFAPGEWTISMQGEGTGNFLNPFCTVGTYIVEGAKCADIKVYQLRDNNKCYGGNNRGCIDTNDDIYIETTIVFGPNNEPYTGTIIQDTQPGSSKQGSSDDGIISLNHGKLDGTMHTLIVRQDGLGLSNTELCRYDFEVSLSCKLAPEATKCMGPPTNSGPDSFKPIQKPFSICSQIPSIFPDQIDACIACTGGSEEQEEHRGVWTAIGCINRNPQTILKSLINLGLGMSGGVALITFLAAGFIFSTSQGDPKAYGKAKDMMTASIVGIIFVIFSVTLLQFIGYEIFKIPGFGG